MGLNHQPFATLMHPLVDRPGGVLLSRDASLSEVDAAGLDVVPWWQWRVLLVRWQRGSGSGASMLQGDKTEFSPALPRDHSMLLWATTGRSRCCYPLCLN